MFKGPIQNHLNLIGGHLCPAILQKTLVLAGMTWGVPRAQYYAMQTWAFVNNTTFTAEIKDGALKTFLEKPPMEVTLMGLPIEIDDSLPTDLIQLRWQGAVLYEIQNIAVPTSF